MQKVLERLEKQGALVEANLVNELKALWHWGIERIKNPALQQSVVEFYRQKVPWQFFVEEASASGKHHPRHHGNRAGLVRHITECCVLAPRLLIYFGFSDKQTDKRNSHAQDVVLAATLLSDTCKNGNPWGPKTRPDHGKISASEWLAYAFQTGVDFKTIEHVYEAVHWHYGRFTPSGEPKELKDLPPLVQIVHLLDVISSSKEIDLLYTAHNQIKIEPTH